MIYSMNEARKVNVGFNPYAKGFTPDQLRDAFYKLTCDPAQAALILECATMGEMEAEYGGEEVMCDTGCLNDCAGCSGRDNGMVLESVRVRQFSRTAQTMAALARALNRYMADKGLTVGEAVIGKPKKSGLFATVTVQFPVSDGQTVTIIFHSPDNNKLQITAADEILAFRWLLNKRDITVAVSPEGEADVSLEEVGKRVAMLVEKNAKAFASKSKEIADQKQQLADVQAQVATLQEENASLNATLNEVTAQSEQIDSDIQATQAQLTKVQEFNADLQSQIDALEATKTGNDGKGSGARPADWETKPPYDDEYTGPRFKYGLMNRPMSIGTQPKGAILMSYKPDDKPENSMGKARHGTLEYPFRLTPEEIASYELLDLTGAVEAEDANAFAEAKEQFAGEMVGRGFAATGTDSYTLEIEGKKLFGAVNYESKSYQFGVRFYPDAFTDKPDQKIFKSSGLDGVNYQMALALAWIDKRIPLMKSAAPAIDPTSPEGYAQIMADPELKLKYQDTLDPFFYSRYEAVRQNLRGLGWGGGERGTALVKQEYTLGAGLDQVGAGKNLVGVQYILSGNAGEAARFVDDLTKTPETIAGEIDAAAVITPDTTDVTGGDTTDNGNPDETAAVAILNDIMAGAYADSGSISDALDSAAEKLEGAGLMEKYDAQLNAAADYLTEVLKKEAA